MKITETEISGQNRKRVLFAIGREEVEILHALVVKAMENFPVMQETNPAFARMKNMQKEMSVYLGLSKPRSPHFSDTKCLYCPRMVKGRKGLIKHVKDVHGKVIT